MLKKPCGRQGIAHHAGCFSAAKNRFIDTNAILLDERPRSVTPPQLVLVFPVNMPSFMLVIATELVSARMLPYIWTTGVR
jgi:hypothetical protein